MPDPKTPDVNTPPVVTTPVVTTAPSDNVEEVQQLQNRIKGLEKMQSEKDRTITAYKEQIDQLETSLNGLQKQIKEKGYDLASLPDLTEFKKIAQNNQLTQLKLKVAQETNLSIDCLEFLNGEDEEVLKKQAEKLVTMNKGVFGKENPPKAPKNTPKVLKKEKVGHFSVYK